MNLPEYREAVRSAQSRFRDTIEEASAVLGKELADADRQLFEEPNRAVPINEDYAVTKRARLAGHL